MHTNRPGLSNSARQRVQLAPERAGDLEVVALVAHDVEEGLVAAELEVGARVVGAERLVGLPVRVAPEVHQRRILGHHAQRVRAGTAPSPFSSSTRMTTSPGSLTRKPSATAANAPGANRSVSGNPATRAPSATSRSVRSIRFDVLPHLSSALTLSRNGSPARTMRRQHRAPAHARPRHDGDLRALRDRHVVVGGDRVGQHAELEFALAVGLQADAGRALPAVAEADGDGVAGRQEILHHADVERAAPGADVALELPLGLQRRAVGGLHRGVARRLRDR